MAFNTIETFLPHGTKMRLSQQFFFLGWEYKTWLKPHYCDTTGTSYIRCEDNSSGIADG